MKWDTDDSSLTDQSDSSSLQSSARSPFTASNILEDLAEQTVIRNDRQQQTSSPVSFDSPLDDPKFDPFSVSRVVKDFLRQPDLSDESASTFGTPPSAENDPFVSTIVGRLVGSLGRQLATNTLRNKLSFPKTGDEIFGFRLRRELGRGAFARVFLSEQKELAERPVALKISTSDGSEPQTLAQLQHTNIVPIYSVHEDARTGLRGVCMPYFGGCSLSQVLTELWCGPLPPTRGSQLVDTLERLESDAQRGAETPPTEPPPKPRLELPADSGDFSPLKHLRGLSFVQASAWIVARLAEGLAHAHSRHVLHRDIKPSNVLLSNDGQPLLLDFNLAQDQLENTAKASIGGTVSYMSPEHLRALIRRKPQLMALVDERSDIYSLGMVLFEMLTGRRPFEQSGSYSAMLIQIQSMEVERSKAAPSVRAERPEVPWSLESIARKCLAPDQSQRYQRAEDVAEDLRRFLEDRPLKFAPELSRTEQAQKWIRRHPRLTYSAGVASTAVVVLSLLGAVLHSVQGRLTQTRQQLHVVQNRDRRSKFEAGTVRALCLVNTVVPLQDHVREGIAACEKTLTLYGFLEQAAWNEPDDWSQLSSDDRERLKEDTRELMMLLAAARTQFQPNDPVVVQSALDLLARADGIPGLPVSKALRLEQARYWRKLGEAIKAAFAEQQAETIPAITFRDHYLLATTLARKGTRRDLSQAIASLDEAIRLEPRHYWSWTQRGLLQCELKEYLLATSDFGHCTGMWPNFAWGYFNRGRVFDQLGKKLEAANEYTVALQKDPQFAAAYVNRGLVSLDLGRPAQALMDFDKSLEFGRVDASLLAGRAMALEQLGRYEQSDEAFHAAFQRLALEPSADRLRILWAYGFAVSARKPVESRRAFNDVLHDAPDNIQALYGLAMLAMNADQRDEALHYFDQALDASPEFIEARRYRAILLARMGALERASQDINLCLEKEPNGARTLYAAACVASRAAERLSDPLVTRQALDLLRRALENGSSRETALNDPDLTALRRKAQFNELLKNTPHAQ